METNVLGRWHMANYYALTKRKLGEVGTVEDPFCAECGDPLESLNDGRYSCVHCLMAGYPTRAKGPRPTDGVDTAYIGCHVGGDPFAEP